MTSIIHQYILIYEMFMFGCYVWMYPGCLRDQCLCLDVMFGCIQAVYVTSVYVWMLCLDVSRLFT